MIELKKVKYLLNLNLVKTKPKIIDKAYVLG